MDFNFKRVSSSLIDHLVFSFVAGFIVFPGLVFDLLVSPFGLKFHYGNFYLNTLALAIYLSKDLILPHSLGKRFMGLVLVPSKEGDKLKAYKLLIRNLTFFVWPIEVMIELRRPTARLGDILAGTRVIEKSDEIEVFKVSQSGRVLMFFFSLVISYVIQIQVQRFFLFLNSQFD